MTAPLTHERLDDIAARARFCPAGCDASFAAAELIAEIRRLRGERNGLLADNLELAAHLADTRALLAAANDAHDELAKRSGNARREIREQSVRNHVAGCGAPVGELVERVLAAVETHLVDPEFRPVGEPTHPAESAPGGAS